MPGREILVGDRNVKALHRVRHSYASLLGTANVVREDPDLAGVQLLGEIRGLGPGRVKSRKEPSEPNKLGPAVQSVLTS